MLYIKIKFSYIPYHKPDDAGCHLGPVLHKKEQAINKEGGNYSIETQ